MTHSGPPFNIICFDCDSTLSRIEGIDALARRAGVEKEIAPLTSAAMDGTLPIDSVYGKRLAMVRPDRASLEWLAQCYIDEIVEGAAETVSTLRALGKSVHIISGGLLPAILPLAQFLGIAADHVHAVDVFLDSGGAYADFKPTSPLTQPNGKAHVISTIAQNSESIAMVGDGLTDVAAREAGAFVLGFGGVVRREVVARNADAFVAGPDLTTTLDILLSAKEKTIRDGNDRGRT